MLIIPEKTPEHGKAAEAKAAMAEEPAFDPPPTYASSSSPPPVITPESSGPPAPKYKPTNYLSLDRANNSIKGTYTIDPFMSIPQSFLPPLAAGETEAGRKNLKLYAKNGSVDVSVNLLADAEKEVGRKRATLDVGSQNGYVDVKLRRIGTSTLVPFHLIVGSHNGSVSVGVPRTFEGLLTIYAKNGAVKISDEITQRITMQNEEKATRRCFVGDISSFNDSEGGWAGDKLDVNSHNGRVKVYFLEEVELEAPKKGGLFSRFLRISRDDLV